jgi:hypothetical protein
MAVFVRSAAFMATAAALLAGTTTAYGGGRTAAPLPTPWCATSMLTGSLRPAGPAAASRYAFLVLTNTSGAPCHLRGYPGIRLVRGSDLLATKVIRLTPPGGPVTVRLAPGQSASALLRWSVIPGANQPPHGPCGPTPTAAWTIPPDQFGHLTLPWTLGMVCRGAIWTTPLSAG